MFSERPEEAETVSSKRPAGRIPRGVGTLISWSAVDPRFRRILQEKRAAAAKLIDIRLDPSAGPVAHMERGLREGTFAEKMGNCSACDFFKQVKQEEGAGPISPPGRSV